MVVVLARLSASATSKILAVVSLDMTKVAYSSRLEQGSAAAQQQLK